MKLTFISNYINHHQIPFSNACYERLGSQYFFIQTQQMEAERIAMGWSEEGEQLPYVHCLYKEEDFCKRLIMESDVLIAGWTDREDLIEERLRVGKLTIRISERIYREGQWKAISPRGLIQKYKDHIKYRNKPVYLLCAGAYVPSDFHLIRAYPNKMFRWGYFPETIYYDEEKWQNLKSRHTETQLVWAGRFISLKHPEYMILLAEALAKAEYKFHIHMVGDGEMEHIIKEEIHVKKLESFFTFYGFCSPEYVRRIMERSHIHIFTSNRSEGWGAVINEAMNSGCAEVVNVQVGAGPYLIEHGVNGLMYQDGKYSSMEEAVRFLLDHPEEQRTMGRKAYETIAKRWNAQTAAEELIRFCENLQNGQVVPAKEGPLSIAPIISPRKMYHHIAK